MVLPKESQNKTHKITLLIFAKNLCLFVILSRLIHCLLHKTNTFSKFYPPRFNFREGERLNF